MAQWTCGECGRRNEESARACAVCGNPADETTAAPPGPPVTPSLSPILPPIRSPEADTPTAYQPQPSYEAPTAYQPLPSVPPQAHPDRPTMAYGTAVSDEPAAGYVVAPVERAGRRRGLLVAGLAVVAVLVLAGGAWYTGLVDRLGFGPDSPAAPTVAPTTDGPTVDPTVEPTVDPTTPTVDPAPTAVGMVAIDPTVTDPRAAAVAELFDAYFSAVNAHDTRRAVSAYDPAGVIDPTNADQVATFERETSTTEDSDVALLAVEDDPSGAGGAAVRARVTFTSRQDPGFGPRGRPSETCTHWEVAYVLTPAGSGYLIHGGSATSAPC
jgi:hypothetical protein